MLLLCVEKRVPANASAFHCKEFLSDSFFAKSCNHISDLKLVINDIDYIIRFCNQLKTNNKNVVINN